MAPDFERLARSLCPIACMASSGIRFCSSALACSCSACAALVRAKTPANSAQAFDALMSTMRIGSRPDFGGSTPNRRGSSPLVGSASLMLPSLHLLQTAKRQLQMKEKKTEE